MLQEQTLRAQLLSSATRSERLDGPREGIDCFDTFNARAQMKTLKARRGDLLVGECFHWLPFTAAIDGWKLFDRSFDAFAVAPASWNAVPHVGLAKKPGADRL